MPGLFHLQQSEKLRTAVGLCLSHKDGKTSFRGGAGYYYEAPNSVAFEDVVGIPPFAPIINIAPSANKPLRNLRRSVWKFANTEIRFRGSLVLSIQAQTLPSPRRAISFSQIFDRHFRLPMVLSWNLTLEHAFKQDWMLRIAYVGNNGHHLSGTGDQENGLLELNPNVRVPGTNMSQPVYPTLWIHRFHQFRSGQQLQRCPDNFRKAHDSWLFFSKQLYLGQGTG